MQAAPLQGWALPDEFGTLRRLLESRMGRRGKREFVQVLRLLETFSQLEVHAAVKDAIHLGSLSFDAVKHLVLCRLEGRPPRLDLELYPYLPRVHGEHHVCTRLYDSPRRAGGMNDRSTLLLEHHLNGTEAAQLSQGVREDGRPVRCRAVRTIPSTCCGWPSWNSSTVGPAHGGAAGPRRPIPCGENLGHLMLDFPAIPSLNKALVMELARCEYIQRRENVIAVGNSGTGKTHVALGLGLAACQRGMSVGFTTAAGLVHELMEARDDRRLLNLQRQLSRLNLLIIDELGFVPLSRTGAELLFEVFSQRYERGSTMVTTNLPFDEWTEVFGSERLTHHVHILEMNGESYRLKRSRETAAAQAPDELDNP